MNESQFSTYWYRVANLKPMLRDAAMGMMVELLLASLALFVWLNPEIGLISALAYNVMLIGGVSTLLFNGNFLLRKFYV